MSAELLADLASALALPTQGARLEALSPPSAGATWKACFSTLSCFVKTLPPAQAPRLVAEAAGLNHLQAALTADTPLYLPSVLGHGSTGQYAWLALEWLDLRPLDAHGGEQLGRGLAELHRPALAPQVFGLNEVTYLGPTPQDNRLQASWPRFFAQQRLAPLLEANASLLDKDSQRRGERLISELAGFFVGLEPCPALLHGDLWSGNAAQLPSGRPVIFDPAVYYGHHEADLAMMELFGGFPERCYAAYRQARPLAPGYEQRKTLYNLYHMLNHALIFGAGYGGQVRRMLASLAAELG